MSPKRTAEDADEGPGAEESAVLRFSDAPDFLQTPRAISVRSNEFERLVEHLSRGLGELGLTGGGVGEVRREPNRCIVQLGEVALTISWVRGRNESVPEGRLLVIEWDGVVGRSMTRTPERPGAAGAYPPATIANEAVLRVEATRAEDWRWCREDEGAPGYSSADLAALCIESLQRRVDALAG